MSGRRGRLAAGHRVDHRHFVVVLFPARNYLLDGLIDFLIKDVGRVCDLGIAIAELIRLISNGRNRKTCCGRCQDQYEKSNQNR